MSDPYAAFGRPVDAAPRQQAPRRQPRPAMPQIRFADDRDAIIRTVLGEAGSEPEVGRQAVAAVIQNRARTRGLTPAQVVLERNQFEPWGNPETASRLMAYTPDSPEYQEVARQIDRVLQGYDPTGGASHFYSPSAQAALGRPAPSWDDGSGFEIGRHRFFRLEGQPGAQQADPFAAYGRPVEDEGAAVEMASAYGQSSPEIGEVAVDRGVVNVNGRAVERGGGQPDRDLGPWEQYQAGLRQSREERIARLEREQNPQYQAEYEAALARSENVPALLENIVQGGTLGAVPMIEGALGWLDPNVAGIDRGLASQAARDASRDRQATLLRQDPVGTIGAQLAGGLLTPGLKGTGNYIAGAQGAARVGRAAQVGAGYGAAQGLISSEGDLVERGDDVIRTGLLGAGVGAVGQRAMDAAGAAAQAVRANPSQARLLSQRGVDLTPGQMMGGATQRVEEGLQSFPILGDSIKSARNRNMGTFDQAAINEALAPINATVAGAGRDAIREADDAISAEYGRILDSLTVTPDQQFQADVQAALNPANLSRNARERLNDTVADVLARVSGPISGRDFKQIESELTGLIQSASRGGPDGKPLIQPLRAVRDALRANLRRQDPQAADDLSAANAAFANFDRIRRAASNPATARNDGLFSPGNLNSVLARAEGRNYGRGEGRLQELSDAGVAVLGDKVPDSGTPLRSLLTMGAPGAGGLTMMGRGDVVAVTGIVTGLGSLGYGKVAQKLLNAAYRRSDPGASREALAELSRIASRDPAALPYYEQLLGLLAPQPQPEPQPAPGGLLSPRQNTRQGLLAQP